MGSCASSKKQNDIESTKKGKEENKNETKD